MSKLLVLKGLPASGKSTYAKELVAKGWKRVNKDDLRSMIDCGKWSKKNEKEIQVIRNKIVCEYLDAGYNVVVDDTNFAPEHEETMQKWAHAYKAEFEVKFFDTPINECVERDAKRGDKSVGSDVIFRMYYKYIRPNIKRPEWNGDLPVAYIFDMDGTLALMKDRSPFDWARVGEDEVDLFVATLLLTIEENGGKILIVSGRDMACYKETEEWLKKYQLPFELLLMRGEGDVRPDQIVKRELYENNIKDRYNVLGVFDDRDSVVSLWRSLGLKCFQCDYGSF